MHHFQNGASSAVGGANTADLLVSRCLNAVAPRLPAGNPRPATMNNYERQRTVAFRKPVRITITVSHSTYDQLQRRCDREGRSLSNLSAYLLEGALSQSSP